MPLRVLNSTSSPARVSTTGRKGAVLVYDLQVGVVNQVAGAKTSLFIGGPMAPLVSSVLFGTEETL